MDPSLFLIARIRADEASDVAFLTRDGVPYVDEDPLDVADGDEVDRVYRLYCAVYSEIDPKLNILSSDQLLAFNRWVLVEDSRGRLAAIALFKTTEAGLKLGILASDGSETGRASAKQLVRLALNEDGVFAEVSGPLEDVLTGRVPVLSHDLAAQVLGKSVEPCDDGQHYVRHISNVGPRRKALVGRPVVRAD